MSQSLTHPHYQFSWQNHNTFQVFCDGDSFFPAMLDCIDAAENFIFLEMYLISSGSITHQFLHSLSKASNRGVEIFIILDDFGARELNQDDRLFMQQHSFHLIFYNPVKKTTRKLSIFRDHRKLLLIDNKIAFIGGAGLSDNFLISADQKNKMYWRDNMLKIEGENIQQWMQIFSQNWYRWSSIKLPAIQTPPSIGQQKGRIAINSGPGKMEINRSFIKQARSAQQRLWLCTPYFAPTRKLIKTIKKISESGVDVRILCPGALIDHPMVRYLAQSRYNTLLKSAVKIYEYQPGFLHAKVVLCDNWVSMGSCNLDRWNFLWNLDANQEVDDLKFSQSVEKILLNDFKNSQQILLEEWKKRSLLNRFQISLYAKFFSLLDNFLSRLRILQHWKTILKEHKKTAN